MQLAFQRIGECFQPKGFDSRVSPLHCVQVISRKLDADERLHRFITKVSKARIWKSENDHIILMLKQLVQSHLEDIGITCENRYKAMSSGSMGMDLKVFRADTEDALQSERCPALPGSPESHPPW